MGLFNETLAGRFNEVIRRLHSMKTGAPAPQVAPEIGHDIVLESDRIEYFVLHQGFPWSVRTQVAALAANFSIVGIRNPVGGGLLIVVTEILVNNSGAVAQSYQLRPNPNIAIASPTPLALTQLAIARDSRKWGPSVGTNGVPPQVFSGTNTSFPFGGLPMEVLTVGAGDDGKAFTSPPYVISPGNELDIGPFAVNQAVDVTCSGYARPIVAEELNIL